MALRLAGNIFKTVANWGMEADAVSNGGQDEEDDLVWLQVRKVVFDNVPANLRTELWLSQLHQGTGLGAAAAAQYPALRAAQVRVVYACVRTWQQGPLQPYPWQCSSAAYAGRNRVESGLGSTRGEGEPCLPTPSRWAGGWQGRLSGGFTWPRPVVSEIGSAASIACVIQLLSPSIC